MISFTGFPTVISLVVSFPIFRSTPLPKISVFILCKLIYYIKKYPGYQRIPGYFCKLLYDIFICILSSVYEGLLQKSPSFSENCQYSEIHLPHVPVLPHMGTEVQMPQHLEVLLHK